MKHGWVSLELVEAILNKLGGENGVHRFLHKIEEYAISVDYDLSLTDAILASRFKAKKWEINDARFPAPGGGVVQVTMSLFSFEKTISNVEDKLAEMHYLGFRPANAFELMAFLTQTQCHRGDSYRTETVALGLVVLEDGYYCVEASGDCLELPNIGNAGYNRDARFLVVREK
jgi:hypothetical protein